LLTDSNSDNDEVAFQLERVVDVVHVVHDKSDDDDDELEGLHSSDSEELLNKLGSQKSHLEKYELIPVLSRK
jgi:hypothetical protein